MTPKQDLVREVLVAGLRAPSAENKHLLQFRLFDDGFTLIATDAAARRLPHRRWLASVSHGALAENMMLRAAELGVGLTVSWLPEAQQPEHVADFHWSDASTPDALARFIELRHTNRHFYRRERLPKSTLSRIETAAATTPGAHVLWLEGDTRRLALHAIRIAETERFKRQELHREMFSAIRFDTGWRGNANEGLPPSALEVEAPARALFAAMRHWRVMHALTRIGAHHALGLRSGYLPAALAPHLGLVVIEPSAAPATAAFQAGRALQRAWLNAAAQGAAFQPIAAPTALALQSASEPGWVSAPVKSQLLGLLGSIAAGCRAQPQMFFRLGLAKPPGGVAQRLPLDRYLA